MKKVFLVIAASMLLSFNLFGSLVEWTVASGGNGHFYEAVADTVTWYQAEAAAHALGGYLATITTEAENNFVFNLVNDSKYWAPWQSDPTVQDGPWLGGYKDGTTWQWETGEAFSYTHWWSGNGWTQPDGSGNGLHFWRGPDPFGTTYSSYWDDKDLGDSFNMNGYVVEFNTAPVPEPSTYIAGALALLPFGASALRSLRKRQVA